VPLSLSNVPGENTDEVKDLRPVAVMLRINSNSCAALELLGPSGSNKQAVDGSNYTRCGDSYSLKPPKARDSPQEPPHLPSEIRTDPLTFCFEVRPGESTPTHGFVVPSKPKPSKGSTVTRDKSAKPGQKPATVATYGNGFRRGNPVRLRRQTIAVRCSSEDRNLFGPASSTLGTIPRKKRGTPAMLAAFD